MATIGDPVSAGLVQSLARPGGNVTGNTFIEPDLGAKRLQLLKELLPAATRIGELMNPTNPALEMLRAGEAEVCPRPGPCAGRSCPRGAPRRAHRLHGLGA
jgi:ABC transporter substrate binding protein